MVTNRQSWGEGRPSLKTTAVATEDVYMEVRWSEERISVDNSIVNGQGKRGLTISYARPGWGVGDILCRWLRRMKKTEFAANIEEVE